MYLIIATVTDASGHVTTRCCAVTAPKSQSQKDTTAVVAQAAAAVAAGVPRVAYRVLHPPIIAAPQ